jgi:hypothetical protein
MMRGFANEEVALQALRTVEGVEAIFECGMLGLKEHNYIACSPDGVALLKLEAAVPGRAFGRHTSAKVDDQNVFALSTVELKTCVTNSALCTCRR